MPWATIGGIIWRSREEFELYWERYTLSFSLALIAENGSTRRFEDVASK